MEKWMGWKESDQFYNVDGRSFYWAFGAVFEKNKGVTSTRIDKSQAKLIFDAMKAGKGVFSEDHAFH